MQRLNETEEFDEPRVAAPAPESAGGARLVEALCSGSMAPRFVFQSIVDLKRGQAAGYEALARFPADEHSSPEPWLHFARRLGMRARLESALFRAALETRRALPENCFLDINVGPNFLLSTEWRRALADVDDFTRIVVEVTEDEAVRDFEEVRRRLSEVRDRGGSIAIDDAGAAYASLNQVLQIRPDFVKLDRVFARNCGIDRAKSALIEMVGQFAGRLDAWLVVEGVETLPDLEEVMRLGAPLAQGYYFGAPTASMEALTAQQSARLETTGQSFSRRDGLAAVVEKCTMCENTGAAEELMRDDDHVTVAVLDRWRRPVALVERTRPEDVRVLRNFTRVHPDSGPAEILERALTRPLEARFDSLAVIDNTGAFLGIVRIDRLAAARNRAAEQESQANPQRGTYTC